MKQTSLLLLVILVLSTGIIVGMSRPAYAAKLFVSWTPPTQNTDGTPLTDLAGYRVEWGTCGPNGTFGTYQSGFNIMNPGITRATIYPTGLKTVCARVFTINSAKIVSASSNVASGTTLPSLSQPMH
jgi:hypothetical protein